MVDFLLNKTKTGCMKGRLLGLLVLLFTAFPFFQGTAAQASSLERWDITKEYTLEQDSVKYHAYLSKDEKESWIYKADLLDKQKSLDIIFPETIQGVPVTCVGMTDELLNETDEWATNMGVYYNLFSAELEPHYDYGKRPSSLIKNVHSVVLPDTITEIGPAAFACMSNLKHVHLPQKIQFLTSYMFYGCRDLQKIDFPSKTKVPANSTALLFCDGLKGLMEEVEIRREGMTITREGDLLINQSEKTLIQVMPTATQITVPANIKEIVPSAFSNSSLKQVKVAKKNKYFAVHKRCLYRKKDGKLLLAFGKGSTLTLSGKVKKIDKSSIVTKYKIKKLVIPKKIKRVGKWNKPYIANNKKVKIYYCGKKIR